jgi:hypothetical protein
MGFDLYGSTPVVQTAGDPTVTGQEPAPAPAQATAAATVAAVARAAPATASNPTPLPLLVAALLAAFVLGAVIVGLTTRRHPARDPGRTTPG